MSASAGDVVLDLDDYIPDDQRDTVIQALAAFYTIVEGDKGKALVIKTAASLDVLAEFADRVRYLRRELEFLRLFHGLIEH